jgi:hypothetical protein
VWAISISSLALRQDHEFELLDLQKDPGLDHGHKTIYEWPDSETGRPQYGCRHFGWTAAVFIDLAIKASREKGRVRTLERFRITTQAIMNKIAKPLKDLLRIALC